MNWRVTVPTRPGPVGAGRSRRRARETKPRSRVGINILDGSLDAVVLRSLDFYADELQLGFLKLHFMCR